MMQLVINTRGTSLRRRGERFAIRKGEESFQFSAAKVSSILVSTAVHFSSDVIQLAHENNVDIIFLDKSGHPTARVWQTKMGSTATIRRRQLEVAESSDGLAIASRWVESKLDNQATFLKELAERRPSRSVDFAGTIETLRELQTKVANCHGTVKELRGTVMGYEGTAGRVYFDCLARLMPSEYPFSGRSRRPASDPFNAMLNYGYGVLYSQVERAIILAGLDPFLGFLHSDNYNKRSLVYDMIEPFRIIAERATVLFFTGRRVKKEFFRDIPGGIELASDGRAALIANLNERLDKSVKYPVQRTQLATSTRSSKPKQKYRRIKLRATIQHEAHSVANQLLGRDDIPKIVESHELFDDET